MIYRRAIQIEFNHCDPAGIVFYPRYFEMTNSVVENFFADVLRYPFARITMEEGCGVPTVHIETDFRAPSRLGEMVEFSLEILRLGRSSATVLIRAEARGEVRLETRHTLVWVAPTGEAAPWPEVIRTRATAFMETVQ
ncbi:MAG: acyl-CoA thioesterase [Paracoccaceae bacterium]